MWQNGVFGENTEKPYEISVSTWPSAKRVPPQYGHITSVVTCSFGVSLCSIAVQVETASRFGRLHTHGGLTVTVCCSTEGNNISNAHKEN